MATKAIAILSLIPLADNMAKYSGHVCMCTCVCTLSLLVVYCNNLDC